MCGIFGYVSSNEQDLSIKNISRKLFLLSESRGKDASGFALVGDQTIKVFKKAVAASSLVKSDVYKRSLKGFINEKNSITCIVGHARMVTNGVLAENHNNQPVIKDGLVAIHNGIIVNDELLWRHNPSLKRNYQVDTEIFLSLLRKDIKQEKSIKRAVKKVYEQIKGAASMAVLFDDYNYLLLATNTGSIYYVHDDKNKIFIFASEYYFLASLLGTQKTISHNIINQLKPGRALLLNLETNEIDVFKIKSKHSLRSKDLKTKVQIYRQKKREILDISDSENTKSKEITLARKDLINLEKEIWKNYELVKSSISNLRRCSRCILPETMPFIFYDGEGVCNYCISYRKVSVLGEKRLRQDIKSFRKRDGSPDCILTFSGGRDSSYGLHYIKNELQMNPVAYSYDWGMLTDIGRRNQSLMTAELGVEHILISADIAKKRGYIKKNVEAWLKDPDLGTVPLFMAGDKQFFYYANVLKKQMGIDLIFLCENPLEKTDFKSGFCGIKPNQPRQEKYYKISLQNKMQMAFYYGKKYLQNPSYFNGSLYDTIDAFISYYFIPHDYVSLYKYVKWEEEKIEKILLKKYNWEVATDTSTTWRIGDGTAALYNFIYFTMAGFSENDTFRSNQIREGQMDRDKALIIANKDNQPRFDSLFWYCETIGLDIKRMVTSIIKAPKLQELKRRKNI